MQKTVVIDVVGLSKNLIGENTPFLKSFFDASFAHIKPVIPAVTTTAQYTYLTGKLPSEHGIVGNGWYDKADCEIKFWKQSNKLVLADKIWDEAKKKDSKFTCANIFWWYNMYADVDYSITPRPQYRANGLKIPDVYSFPASLRDELQKELGQFPLFKFWGPATSIQASLWIANSAIHTDKKHDPTLTLIYLPHLDYGLQKFGPNGKSIPKDLNEIDAICKKLHDYYSTKKANIIFLSEYGISPVNEAITPNRILREKGLLAIREENGKELLDAGASKAFAVCDHQIAHIYLNDTSVSDQVIKAFSAIKGIKVITGLELEQIGLKHVRAGDIVLIAKDGFWFSYYYWNTDTKAPDFARTVEIHKKPGYDPVEMFINPKINFPKLKIIGKLIKKKLGFRTLMDVIPLDNSLIKGSHGNVPLSKDYWPVIGTNFSKMEGEVPAPDVYNIILKAIFSINEFKEKAN